MPMRSRQVQKTTTSHTALTGVPVYLLMVLQKLLRVSKTSAHRHSHHSIHAPRKRQSIVPSKCITHARICQHGGASGEELDQDDKKPHDRPPCPSTGVEKYLRHWKAGWRVDDAVVVGQAEAERDSEHPTSESRDENCRSDGNRSSDGGVVRLLGHAAFPSQLGCILYQERDPHCVVPS